MKNKKRQTKGEVKAKRKYEVKPVLENREESKENSESPSYQIRHRNQERSQSK